MTARQPTRLESTLEEQLLQHRFALRERFGEPATGAGTRSFFAPGRVNLMGAHLDYNGGPVMPMAIDRGTFVALRPRADRRLRLASTVEPGEIDVSLEHPPAARTGTWCDYPLGVALALRAEGRELPGLDVLFGGNLPIGGGLSSSASICVGTAYALERAAGRRPAPSDLARVALAAERGFVGVKCGIMDPYAVAFARAGHLLWLDCRDETTEHVPLDHAALTIAVVDSGVRRDLARGEFNARVDECARAFRILAPQAPGARCLRDVPLDVVERAAPLLPEPLLSRARHVVTEVARTFAAREHLLRRDFAGLGRTLLETQRSLAELYEVSIPELDELVERARVWPGTYGARLTGAGFGGCCVVLLAPEARAGFAEHVQGGFEARFGRRPAVHFFRGDPGPREIE
jgi:galactokinase